MARSISVIMLVDELIANLWNIHNEQFLLRDNELAQSKGLQPLVWRDSIGRLLPYPEIIPARFLPMAQVWKSRARSEKVPRGGRTERKQWPLSLDTKWKSETDVHRFQPQGCPPTPRLSQVGLRTILFCDLLYSQLLFFFNDIALFKFIYLFLAVLSLRFCARAFSSCGERGPLFIAVRGPLTVAASLVAEHRLQTRRLSSCGSRAQLLRGTWDLPRPRLEPVSPALAGRFSTTAPPGKPSTPFT